MREHKQTNKQTNKYIILRCQNLQINDLLCASTRTGAHFFVRVMFKSISYCHHFPSFLYTFFPPTSAGKINSARKEGGCGKRKRGRGRFDGERWLALLLSIVLLIQKNPANRRRSLTRVRFHKKIVHKKLPPIPLFCKNTHLPPAPKGPLKGIHDLLKGETKGFVL